jgi:ribosomal-protein-alanine N-acetyltransferase
MTEGFRIVPMALAHVDQVVQIERLSFTDPWSRGMFRSELEIGELSFARAALEGERLVGYLLAVVIPDEAHLGNIAVHPDWRGRGIGQMLLDDLLTEARRAGVKRITLEVRESNEGARKFYYDNQFIDVAIRRNYYRNPVEDAMVMLRSLPEGSIG